MRTGTVVHPSIYVCQRDGCGQLMGEQIGAFVRIREHGRDWLVMGVVTMRCPRCKAPWLNPSIPISDEMLSEFTSMIEDYTRRATVARESDSRAASWEPCRASGRAADAARAAADRPR